MKIYLEVYGCTANKSDAALIIGILKANFHQIVKHIEQADILILVTCTVIGTTEQRMLSRLREFKKFDKQVIVTGCMASVQADLIKSILPDSYLLHPKYSNQIINLLENKKVDFSKENIKYGPKYYDGLIAPLSIAEGCLFDCSYCITSPARGNLRSFTKEQIEKDIYCALKQNCKEIQLTAQDTASYGFDVGSNLGKLLSSVSTINGDFKIRVGMMNPYTALKNLNEIIKGFYNKKIYKFLHIPVQSGDNGILELMNRKYTVEDFLIIIKKFRSEYPNITISTDTIVGFPGETNQQFYKTIDLIKKIKPDIVNVTRFSPRPMTKAKKMTDKINTKIAKERSRELVKLCNKISFEKNNSYKSKSYNVLVIKKSKNNSHYISRTNNYKPVLINEKVNLGDSVNVEIIDFNSIHLFGKLI